MSNRKPVAYDLIAISEYIDQHTAHGKKDCPFCGSKKWLAEIPSYQHVGDPSNSPAPAHLMKVTEAFFGSAPSIPLLVLTCDNCGFVRTHNLTYINERIEQEKGDE